MKILKLGNKLFVCPVVVFVLKCVFFFCLFFSSKFRMLLLEIQKGISMFENAEHVPKGKGILKVFLGASVSFLFFLILGSYLVLVEFSFYTTSLFSLFLTNLCSLLRIDLCKLPCGTCDFYASLQSLIK